ncbi:FAD-binding protein [Sagittula sp. NFXS13]|uniref:FAD-binding protein n=1 Tax=Sagittula sp. NFXS13 TaxID=2819095 RepID=UPI0032DEF535
MKPGSEAELAEMVRDATGGLRVRGGGTRPVGSGAGEVLDTTGLSGIHLYEPGALTVVAGAGTPLSEIERRLDAEGQRLAFEPMDHRGLLGTAGESTIGGVVAANVSGPRRIQAGACRDFLLGVRFVDGQGTVIKNGGRVMKNVTGYDLVKLMAGSRGTLGVLSEVSLKVLPKPEAAATILIDGLDDAQAVSAMARGLGSPFDVTGAAHLPEGPDGHAVTLLRVEGFSESVDYRADTMATLFGDLPVRVERDPVRVAQLWTDIRDVAPMKGANGDVWRISCKPSDAPALVEALAPTSHIFDWGGGLIWALMPEGTDARTRLGMIDGHATRVRGAGTTPVFPPESAPVAALTRAIRQRFDPRGILNPGSFH